MGMLRPTDIPYRVVTNPGLHVPNIRPQQQQSKAARTVLNGRKSSWFCNLRYRKQVLYPKTHIPKRKCFMEVFKAEGYSQWFIWTLSPDVKLITIHQHFIGIFVFTASYNTVVVNTPKNVWPLAVQANPNDSSALSHTPIPTVSAEIKVMGEGRIFTGHKHEFAA